MTHYFYIVCFLSCTALSAAERNFVIIKDNYKKYDINQITDKYGNEIPLMKAIVDEDDGAVESLLQQKASTEIENRNGDFPIHVAMEWDTEKRLYPQKKILPNIIKLLLQHNANPNVRYRFKNATPLHAAAFHNAPDIVIELLRHGADKNVYDERGFTPLEIARLYDHQKIINILSIDNVPPAYLLTQEELIASFYEIPLFTILQKSSSTEIIDDYRNQAKEDQSCTT